MLRRDWGASQTQRWMLSVFSREARPRTAFLSPACKSCESFRGMKQELLLDGPMPTSPRLRFLCHTLPCYPVQDAQTHDVSPLRKSVGIDVRTRVATTVIFHGLSELGLARAFMGLDAIGGGMGPGVLCRRPTTGRTFSLVLLRCQLNVLSSSDGKRTGKVPTSTSRGTRSSLRIVKS